MTNKPLSVLFVCLGNICRSPTAHAIFRQKVADTNLNIHIDSAGTAGYHIGAKPDPRSVKHGEKRGYDFSGLSASAVQDSHFEQFDFILAMDKSNYKDLVARCPEQHQHKVQLFLDYSATYPDQQEVPDPYYGGAPGFEFVINLVEDASDGLIKHIENQIG